MIGISAMWIALLLGLGGFTLDRVLTSAITRNFDAQLDYVLTAMIASAEIGPEGEVLFNRPPADQRFLEPYSGLYYQISGEQGFDRLPVALAVGPAARGRMRATSTPTSISTTATNSRWRSCASSSATCGCPARRCAGASRSRRAAT